MAVRQLIIVCRDREVRSTLCSLSDFTQVILDPVPGLSWPVFESGSCIVMDGEIFEALPEPGKHSVRSQPLLLLVNASLPEAADIFYREADIRFFCCEPNNPFNQENLLSMVRCIADLATMTARLNSYISDSFRNIVDSDLLERQKVELEELNAKLRVISRIDPLTNLLNRRALLEAFDQEKRRAIQHCWCLRQSGPAAEDASEPLLETDFLHAAKGNIADHLGNFACMIIDIDFFKRVNDTYGHLTGDKVLRSIGELLNREGIFRNSDIKGRFGGEEFIVIQTETNAENSMVSATRLREAVRELCFKSDDGRSFSITISVGVAQFLPEELSCDEMVKRADVALYWAKEHGRNQVCLYDNSCQGVRA